MVSVLKYNLEGPLAILDAGFVSKDGVARILEKRKQSVSKAVVQHNSALDEVLFDVRAHVLEAMKEAYDVVAMHTDEGVFYVTDNGIRFWFWEINVYEDAKQFEDKPNVPQSMINQPLLMRRLMTEFGPEGLPRGPTRQQIVNYQGDRRYLVLAIEASIPESREKFQNFSETLETIVTDMDLRMITNVVPKEFYVK